MRYSDGIYICTYCGVNTHFPYNYPELHDIWFQIEYLVQSSIPEFTMSSYFDSILLLLYDL